METLKIEIEPWADSNTRLDVRLSPEQLGLDREQEFEAYEDLWNFCKSQHILREYEVWDWILYPSYDDIYTVSFYVRPQ